VQTYFLIGMLQWLVIDLWTASEAPRALVARRGDLTLVGKFLMLLICVALCVAAWPVIFVGGAVAAARGRR